MCIKMENMGHLEAMIRFYIAIFLMVISVHYENQLLLVLPIIILYTAINKKCLIYSVFKMNTKIQDDKYFQSLLPKHNPSPVYIFDENGQYLFRNGIASDEFDAINNLSDLKIPKDVQIDKQSEDKIEFDYKFKLKENYYHINIVRLLEYNYTLAYLTDITEIVNLDNEIEKTQSEIIYAMGEIGESRSKETGNHVKRVALYSSLLARKSGMNEEEAKILQMASPMHDIGKVGIPDAILNKPGKHTKEEFDIMKTHAQLGYNMLNSSEKPIIKAAAIVSLEHHEKYDGSGYPNALKAKNIHIYGRITAIADVFDALGSDRVYKKAWPLDNILALFKEERSKHFDPELVDLFFENLDEFLLIRDSFKDVE